MIAVYTRDEDNSFVWEANIVTPDAVDPHAFSMQYPRDTPVEYRDEAANEVRLKAAQDWARQHIAQTWGKHPDFVGVTVKEVELKQVMEAKALGELPGLFVDVAKVTRATALRDWLGELASVPRLGSTVSQ